MGIQACPIKISLLTPSGKDNSANCDVLRQIQEMCAERATTSGTTTSAETGPALSQSQFEYQYEAPKHWSQSDVNTLIRARCQDNPPTFRQIAEELNRFHEHVGTQVDRKFTAKQCSNKWYSLFPNELDANRTVEYCRKLQRQWPNLQYFTKTERVPDNSRPPKLIALHIVWPWIKQIVSTLTDSTFCDATCNVTIYDYQVVCFSTLDGNKQHRPLMTSFIAESTGPMWKDMFNHYATHVLPDRRPPPMYVITTDQEKTIQSGLRTSVLHESMMHLFCGVHSKWNVRDHK